MSSFYALEPAEQARLLEAAAHDALSNWRVDDAELTLIKHRENAVFRVDADDGSTTVLRLHRYGYHSDAELRSEHLWAQALAAAGIRVPVVVPTISGSSFARQAVLGLPGPVQVVRFEWIDGEPLGSVEQGVAAEAQVEATHVALGELAARVHNQAAVWKAPAGFTRHAWDAAGLAGEAPVWGRFWELEAATKAQRGLLERARDAVFRDLAALSKTPAAYSMIHADFAPENVMVEGDRVRLIDFDDSGYGWHLFELATALYFIRSEPYYERAKDALIAGYRKHRSLSDEQLESLPLLMLARGTTYVGWVHTRSETDTARELTPMILEMACELAEDYLSHEDARDD